MIRFKKLIENNKSINFSKVKFYLRKASQNLKCNQDLIEQSVKVLNINTNNDKSDIPYIFGHLRKGGEIK